MLNKYLNKNLITLANYNLQQFRNVRVHKPPWVPRSKAKAFRVPPLHEPNPEEIAYMTPIWRSYRAQMRSVYQLFKTEFKFSDKASLKAQEEKRAKAAEEKILYEQNDKLNRELLEFQLAEEEQKLEAKKKQMTEQLEKNIELERAYVRLADEKVRKLKEKVKTFIDPNNLEFEIEKMLNERNEYNFSINASGQIFKNGQKVSRKDGFNTKFISNETNKSIDSSTTPSTTTTL